MMRPTNCTCMKSFLDNLVITCKDQVINTSASSFTSICACECKKNCNIDECLNNCTCVKSVFNNLVITCEDEVVNTSTNSFNKK